MDASKELGSRETLEASSRNRLPDPGVSSSSANPTINQLNESVYEIYKPRTGIPQLQIFFFHGLQFGDNSNSHLTTWVSSDKSQSLWPQTWLVEEIPGVQIFTISCNSVIRKKRELSPVGDEWIPTLIQNLETVRQDCPAILVGHSFGGLVIKKIFSKMYRDSFRSQPDTTRAMMLNFLGSLRGVFMYGTPHAETRNLPKTLEVFRDRFPLFAFAANLFRNTKIVSNDFDKLRCQSKWVLGAVGEEYLDTRWGTYGQADHISVCKPKGKFQLLADFIRKDAKMPHSLDAWSELNYVVLSEIFSECIAPTGNMDSWVYLGRGGELGTILNHKIGSSIVYTEPQWEVKSTFEMRSDIQSLGFKSFDVPFDPCEILCLYSFRPEFQDIHHGDQDKVHILCFHAEGMKNLFGVGLSFAKVVLKSNLQLVIEEMSERSWKDLWAQSNQTSWEAILIECPIVAMFKNSTRIESLSVDEAVQTFGVGIEGSNISKIGGLEHNIGSLSKFVSQSDWIKDFITLLHASSQKGVSKENIPSQQGESEIDAVKKAKLEQGKMKENSGSETRESSSGGHLEERTVERNRDPQSGRPDDNVEDSDGECSNNDATYIHGNVRSECKEEMLWEITVIIDKNRSTKVDETPKVPAAYFDPFPNSACISPVLLIQFCLSKDQERIIFVKCAVNYVLNSIDIFSDRDKFGWYHDDLIVSLECEDENAALVENHEVLSKTISSEVGQTINQKESDAVTKGKSSRFSVGVAPGHVVVGAARSSQRATSHTHTKERQTTNWFSAARLENCIFSIKHIGDNPSKLAYLSFISRAFEDKIWDTDGRYEAKDSGILTNISIVVRGKWRILSGSSQDKQAYKFIASRKLRQVIRREEIVPVPFNISNFVHWKRKDISTREHKKSFHQEVDRRLLLSHNFSHLKPGWKFKPVVKETQPEENPVPDFVKFCLV